MSSLKLELNIYTMILLRTKMLLPIHDLYSKRVLIISIYESEHTEFYLTDPSDKKIKNHFLLQGKNIKSDSKEKHLAVYQGGDELLVFYQIRGKGYKNKFHILLEIENEGDLSDFAMIKDDRIAVLHITGTVQIYSYCEIDASILQKIEAKEINLNNLTYEASSIICGYQSKYLIVYIHEKASFALRGMSLYKYTDIANSFQLQESKTFQNHNLGYSLIKLSSIRYEFMGKPVLVVFQGFHINELRLYTIGKEIHFIKSIKLPISGINKQYCLYFGSERIDIIDSNGGLCSLQLVF